MSRVRKILGEEVEVKEISGHLTVQCQREEVREVLKKILDEFREVHLTTIVGCDLGEEIEVTYHLYLHTERKFLAVRTRVPKSDAKIPSVTELIPGAELYECELYEMLGVRAEGHPRLRRVFLPEDYPEDQYPLRRS